jgi:hypothetical protein
MFGFNEGTADVRIDVHAPTGDGNQVFAAEVPLEQAQGNEVSAVLSPVDLTDPLSSYEPHPQQGYHVKLYVDRRESAGGAKQKVFWVQCEAAAEAFAQGQVLAAQQERERVEAAERAAAAERAEGQRLAAGAELPRTGGALVALTVIGTLALAAGLALTRLGRRRSIA